MTSLWGRIYLLLVTIINLFVRYASAGTILNVITKRYPLQVAPDTVPPRVRKAGVTVQEYEYVARDGRRRWQVFTCRPPSREGKDEGGGPKKVVVYFHGGAFVRAMTPKEWSIPLRFLLPTPSAHSTSPIPTPVIVPIWTLAPHSCALDFRRVVLSFLLDLAADPVWAGYEVVLSGTSAGGWCAWTALLALCEAALGLNVALGAGAGGEQVQEEARALMQRIRRIVLFSPVVDVEVTDALKEAEKSDPWLSYNLFSVVSPLWTRGPLAVDSKLYDALSPSARRDAEAWWEETRGIKGDDKLFCPINNLGVLDEYLRSVSLSPSSRGNTAEQNERQGAVAMAAQNANATAGRLHVQTFQGGRDILGPQNRELHRRLKELSGSGLTEELLWEEGLFHVYMGVPIPESELGWQRIYAGLEDAKT